MNMTSWNKHYFLYYYLFLFFLLIKFNNEITKLITEITTLIMVNNI